jgi:hypothetical protein
MIAGRTLQVEGGMRHCLCGGRMRRYRRVLEAKLAKAKAELAAKD